MGIETLKKKGNEISYMCSSGSMAIHSRPISSNLGKLLLKYDHLNPFEFHVAMQLLAMINF
jgi:hypothetical protein